MMVHDMPKSQLYITEWLQTLNLSIYNSCFQDFRTVADIINLKENDIKNLGVRNGAHRAKISSSLFMLCRNYEKTNDFTTENKSKIRLSKSSPVHNKSFNKQMEPVTDLETSSEDLKKALEWELKLDSRDLRSHAWYHGTIPRPRAEELLEEDGDFLIRDCISQPGDFVLTCYNAKSPVHFVINKVILQPHTVYERIQYQFEDDSFDTIPDLVTYYVGNKRPISAASGAIITRPVNRSMPLSYYASKYSLEHQKTYVTNVVCSSPFSPISSPKNSPRHTPKNSPPVGKKFALDASQRSLKQQNYENNGPNYSGNPKIVRVGSDPMLSPSIERKPWEFRHSGSLNSSEVLQQLQEQSGCEKPPPKPSRIPSMRTNKKPEVVVRRQNSTKESDKENYSSDNISNQSTLSGQSVSSLSGSGPILPEKTRQVNTTEARLSILRHRRRESTDSISLPKKIPITLPEEDPKSLLHLDSYRTYLLPSSGENKPLEMSTLLHIKSMLLDIGSKTLASHMTKVDLRILRMNEFSDHGLGVSSGLELLLLPQGYKLREDILERAECMKLFVAVSILMAASEEERMLMINKWIQIADDTKTALGNLYGFHNIMCALTLKKIEKLDTAWLSIRQNYTQSAFTFETKLRPTLKAMMECNNPEAPNTSIPFIIPLAVMLDHSMPTYESDVKARPILKVPWEEPGIDYGLNLLFKHMDYGRNLVKHVNLFKRNKEIVLEKMRFDEVILDMFCTEFQLKFLWGSRGATVDSNIRYTKFQQILDAMSQGCEKIAKRMS